MNDDDYPDLRDQVLELIKEKMELNNVSQRELARRLNVSQPMINKYLHGNQNYQTDSLQKIIHALGYHPVLGATKMKK